MVDEDAVTERADRWRASLVALGVPPRYQSVPATLPIVPDFAAWTGDPWAVTILGGVGTGKTWQAVRLLGLAFGQRALGAGCRAAFVDASALLLAVGEDIGQGRGAVSLCGAIEADALLVDDLGAERDNAFARDKLGLILRQRYNWMRPTIVTSNASSVADLAALDARVASRLAEGIVRVIEGRDRRIKRGAA